MGLGLWIAAGVVAWLTARIVPAARMRGWIGELAASMIASTAAGFGATALDFGGWKEPDPRAGAHAFLGAVAVVGAVRQLRIKN